MKKNIKIITFILIFCLLWHYIFSIMKLKKNNISYFYDEPKNSIDIIYIGSSSVHHQFNPLLAYDLYGFTTYLLSTGNQPFTLVKYLIEESEKTQDPDLYIIDLARLQDDFVEDFSEEWSRAVIDSMKYSKTRLNAINDLLKFSKISRNDYINYYFNFFLYHNSWKNIGIDNFNLRPNKYKGYFFDDPATTINPQLDYVWTDESYELPDSNKQVLLDLIKYIENNHINVLFVIPKSTFWEPGYQWLNSAVSIIQKHNLDIINLNLLENLNIYFDTDFYDANHLNVYGATKYTIYLSNYLKENYILKNHKGDEKYDSWEFEYANFKLSFYQKLNTNFDGLVTEYSKLYN